MTKLRKKSYLRTMKQKLTLFFAFFMLLAASCGKLNPNPEITIKNEMKLDNTVSRFGTTLKIDLDANFDYGVQIEESAMSWVGVLQADRSLLSLRIESNSDTVERETEVKLTSENGVVVSIRIYQNCAEPVLIYPAPQNEGFHRMMYIPSYRGVDAASIPDEYLKMFDVVAYAFARLNDDLSVTIENPTKVSTLVSRCKALGVKLVISFAGNSSAFKAMTSTGKGRTKFVNDIMRIVDHYKLDGVDNDWEFPSTASNTADPNMFLMRQFSNILHAPGENKLLMMAVITGMWQSTREGIRPGVFDCVDWLNIMSYNYITSKDTPETYNAMYVLTNAAENWCGTAKLPKNKFVGGLPLYATNNQSPTVNLAYKTVLSKGGDPDKDASVLDYNGKKMPFFYDGKVTIKKKVEWLMDQGMGGYFFWESSYDTYGEHSLIRTAYDAWRNH